MCAVLRVWESKWELKSLRLLLTFFFVGAVQEKMMCACRVSWAWEGGIYGKLCERVDIGGGAINMNEEAKEERGDEWRW